MYICSISKYYHQHHHHCYHHFIANTVPLITIATTSNTTVNIRRTDTCMITSTNMIICTTNNKWSANLVINRQLFRCCACIIFQRDWRTGLTLLFCWSCTNRATLSTIVYFDWSPQISLKNYAHVCDMESRLLSNT